MRFLLPILLLLATPGFARILMTDPKGDSHGAGCVVYPTASVMSPGMFDITAFSLKETAGRVVIKLTMASPVKLMESGIFQDKRTRTFLPVIDIYVSRNPKKGYTRLLPGRGARPEIPWQRVVVITGLPETVASHLAVVMGPARDRICVPRNVVIRGRQIRAVMPASCIGSTPQAYKYLIGVLALRPMMGLKHLVSGFGDFNDPLIVPMAYKPGVCNTWTEDGCTFGVCTAPDLSPRFLDLLLPKGLQSKVLKPTNGECKLPFISATGILQDRHLKAKNKGFPVQDMKNNIITLLLPLGFDKTGIVKGRLAGLYDQEGRMLTTVVVTKVLGRIVVLAPLNRIKPRKGLEVRF